MATEHRAMIDTLYDRISQGDLSVLDELVADDVVEHDPPAPDLPPGREGVRQWFQMMHAAIPDMRFVPADVLGEGDRCVCRFRFGGTHQGDLMGVPATGRHFEIQGFDMFRIADGKVAEHWGVVDSMSLLQQLGVLPEALAT